MSRPSYLVTSKAPIGVAILSLSKCHQCGVSLPRIYEHTRFLIVKDNLITAYCAKCLEGLVLNNAHLITCPCCHNHVHRLVLHHWYEPPTYEHQTRRICDTCNTILIPRTLWGIVGHANRGKSIWLTHILPSWNLQLLFVNDYKSYCTQIYKNYPYPLPQPLILTYKEAMSPTNSKFPVKAFEDGHPVLWYDVNHIRSVSPYLIDYTQS